MNIFDGVGFIGLEDFNNVMTSEADELERDIRKNGMPAAPGLLFDMIDNIRLKVNARAKHNLDAYLKANPTIKKDVREAKDKTVVEDNKKTWQERVQKSRQMGYHNQP